MSDVVSDRPPANESPVTPVIARLSFLDRFLPVWIVAAMAIGIGLGRAIPSLNKHLNAIQVTSGTSLPIFIGLLVMMYPVLAKVRYDRLGSVTRDRKMLVTSLVLNWVVGPAVMFALAWLLLPDLPTYRTGLIIVGLARCIAMVLIWNDLSGGDREAAAVLVAINSLFQVVAFALLGYFYLKVLPGWLGLSTVGLHLSVGKIAETVAIFLGVPLVAGFLTRTFGERARGREWYETKLLPHLAPFALYGLLYTIVILFALQGHTITSRPADVARIALPLLGYFAVMWFGSFALGKALGLPYERTATLRSRPRATTSSWRLRWPSACSASPVAKHWQVSSALSSKFRSSSPWCTCPCGPDGATTRQGLNQAWEELRDRRFFVRSRSQRRSPSRFQAPSSALPH